jgi:hypothetical protein
LRGQIGRRRFVLILTPIRPALCPLDYSVVLYLFIKSSNKKLFERHLFPLSKLYRVGPKVMM